PDVPPPRRLAARCRGRARAGRARSRRGTGARARSGGGCGRRAAHPRSVAVPARRRLPADQARADSGLGPRRRPGGGQVETGIPEPGRPRRSQGAALCRALQRHDRRDLRRGRARRSDGARGRVRVADRGLRGGRPRRAAARHRRRLAAGAEVHRADPAGERPIAQVPLYLDDVAAEAVDAVRTLAEQKQVQVEVGAFEEAKITGDPTLIRQLLLIVLDNAVKFTATGGKVRLDVSADHGRATVVVLDTGVGITAEHLPTVFERFYRGEPA